MLSHRFVQLDVFTEEAFSGNSLAVFPDGSGIADEDMLKIAREMNLSETVFVLEPDNSKKQSPSPLKRLRIFTPTREIPFAGHPVVGTWNLLAREGIVPKPESGTGWTRIHHEIGIGILPVDIEFKDGEPVQVVMTQGKAEMGNVLEDAHEQADLIRSLGLAPEHLDENLPIQIISTGMKFLWFRFGRSLTCAIVVLTQHCLPKFTNATAPLVAMCSHWKQLKLVPLVQTHACLLLTITFLRIQPPAVRLVRWALIWSTTVRYRMNPLKAYSNSRSSKAISSIDPAG